jgi:hypothetical protein
MTDVMLLSDIVALERRFWEAADDPDVYRECFADDAVVVLERGLLDKAAMLEETASAKPWERHTMSDVRLVDIGDGVVALSYRASAERNGGNHRYDATVSSVYVCRSGTWKLVLHQQTPDN